MNHPFSKILGKSQKNNPSVEASPPGTGRLPNFIIIGAQKCGTSSLFRYIMAHPNALRPTIKEVHFFDINYSKGLEWYKSHFPDRSEKIVGESSPYYIFHPLCARRIHADVPSVKLIALLRNPIDRAFSNFWHTKRLGEESLSFEEAIRAELKRLDGEEKKIVESETYISGPHRAFSYLARGIYVDQLDIWMKYFDKSQVLILKSEDLFSNPPLAVKKTFEFLELPPFEIKEFPRFNAGEYSQMNQTTRRMLADYFKAHNERLYSKLETDFNWK